MNLLRMFPGCASITAMLIAAAVHGAPIVPIGDDQIVETLPVGAAQRATERRMRRQSIERPADARLAAAQSRSLLEQARQQGDPRHAGQALAALQAWPDADSAPDPVLLMQASVQQYLHDFDGAIGKLQTLLRRSPSNAQAWLSLATLQRVQGRYAESDRACTEVSRQGVALHGAACSAENAALRGHADIARDTLRRLLAQPRIDEGTRGWLLTTMAELEVRAGSAAAAQADFSAAIAAARDEYTRLAQVDFLLHNGRAAEALARLEGWGRTDAVLLRLAVAGPKTGSAQAAVDAAEMRERIAAANQRPEAQRIHSREQTMFMLWVEADAAAALRLARINVAQQREPVDVLLLAQAARAAGDAAALREVARLKQEIGLHDQRIDALL